MSTKKRKNKNNFNINLLEGGGTAGIMQGIGDSLDYIGNTVGSISFNSPDKYRDKINDIRNYRTEALTNTGLLNEYSNFTTPDKISYRDIRGYGDAQVAGNVLGGLGAGASIGTSIMPGIGTAIGAVAGGVISGIKEAFMTESSKNKASKLNAERKRASDLRLDMFANNADYINQQNMLNSYKVGGPIHIKKENRGKFTDSANRAGMGVQEYARHILANKEDYSPLQVKRANFARNFGGNRKAEGGYLEGSVYDLNESEIERLLNLGYEIEYI